MIRGLALAVLAVMAMALPAYAEEAGRFQILSVPLAVDGLSTATVLVDTYTGRSWYASIDDSGRPRWRGFQFYTESTGKLEPPPVDKSITSQNAEAAQAD